MIEVQPSAIFGVDHPINFENECRHGAVYGWFGLGITPDLATFLVTKIFEDASAKWHDMSWKLKNGP